MVAEGPSWTVASGASKPPLNPMLGDPVAERFLGREPAEIGARTTDFGSWTLAYIAMAIIGALVLIALLLAR